MKTVEVTEQELEDIAYDTGDTIERDPDTGRCTLRTDLGVYVSQPANDSPADRLVAEHGGTVAAAGATVRGYAVPRRPRLNLRVRSEA